MELKIEEIFICKQISIKRTIKTLMKKDRNLKHAELKKGTISFFYADVTDITIFPDSLHDLINIDEVCNILNNEMCFRRKKTICFRCNKWFNQNIPLHYN